VSGTSNPSSHKDTKMSNKILTVVTIIASICAIMASLAALDARHAKQAEVTTISKRLDKKIKFDRANDLQMRIWKLEDRYKDEAMPAEVLSEVRQHKLEYNAILVEVGNGK